MNASMRTACVGMSSALSLMAGGPEAGLQVPLPAYRALQVLGKSSAFCNPNFPTFSSSFGAPCSSHLCFKRFVTGAYNATAPTKAQPHSILLPLREDHGENPKPEGCGALHSQLGLSTARAHEKSSLEGAQLWAASQLTATLSVPFKGRVLPLPPPPPISTQLLT